MGPQTKKRKLAAQVEEISFDAAARQEFLTGFRKRKQQRIKHAQETAVRKAQEAKREDRRKMREERTADFQRALEEHRKQMETLKEENGSAGENGSDYEEEEWDGITEPPAVDYEAEYIDEDKYTTVTVEEMDPSREGLMRSEDDSEDEEQTETDPPSKANADSKQPAGKSKKSTDSKPKKKKKKFRYESKEDRKLARAKERMSNHRKAKARRER